MAWQDPDLPAVECMPSLAEAVAIALAQGAEAGVKVIMDGKGAQNADIRGQKRIQCTPESLRLVVAGGS